jgi:AbrB family looped-hinge helix DNA binding protein
MDEFYSSVSPKGQVTVPQAIRRKLGLRVKDQVRFRVVGNQVVLTRVESKIAKHAQSIPALKERIDVDDAILLAMEEHAEEVAQEGADER